MKISGAVLPLPFLHMFFYMLQGFFLCKKEAFFDAF